MRLNKEMLASALELVKPGLATKEFIEQSTSFAFIEGRVVTYNDEICLSHPVEGLNITGAIKANEFYQFINKIKKEEIDVEISDNEILFKSGRTKAGFTLQKEIKLPLDEVAEKGRWKKLPEDFSHYLSLAAGACGKDDTLRKATCVYIQKEGILIGSDGNKIMKCDLETDFEINTCLLDAHSALEVVSLNPYKVAESEGWLHFKTKKGTILSCRLLDDTYMSNIEELIVVEGVEITFPNTIINMLERASVFAKRDYILDENVDIQIEKNKLCITAKSDTGWYKDSIKIVSEEDVAFSITPYLLRDILKETKNFRLSENAVKFIGAGWEYVATLKETIE